MTTNRGPRDLFPFLEADIRRLEVELEFARERMRRCVDEIEAEARESERRAAQPTVRLRRRPNTLPAFDALPPTEPAHAMHSARRGATLALGAMPMPTPMPPPSHPEPSGVREVGGTGASEDAGRYEFVAELTRKRPRDSARFTGGSR